MNEDRLNSKAVLVFKINFYKQINCDDIIEKFAKGVAKETYLNPMVYFVEL